MFVDVCFVFRRIPKPNSNKDSNIGKSKSRHSEN